MYVTYGSRTFFFRFAYLFLHFLIGHRYAGVPAQVIAFGQGLLQLLTAMFIDTGVIDHPLDLLPGKLFCIVADHGKIVVRNRNSPKLGYRGRQTSCFKFCLTILCFTASLQRFITHQVCFFFQGKVLIYRRLFLFLLNYVPGFLRPVYLQWYRSRCFAMYLRFSRSIRREPFHTGFQ